MSVTDIERPERNFEGASGDRNLLNSFTASRALNTLWEKLLDVGIHELRWHGSVPSYERAVANSGKSIVGEYFREDLHTLPPSRFFGVTGHDESGRTVCTSANRYDDVAGWDLREYLQHFWQRAYKAEGGGQARLSREAMPFVEGMRGPFAYIGDTSVDPSLSGSDVASYLVRLCVLACYLEWHPPYIYGWMARHHAAKGLSFRWGFPIVWPGGMIWDRPPENEAYSNLCFALCPALAVAQIVRAPLDIGVLPRRANNTA